MRIKKGFPSGIMFVKENLRPLVNKMHQLSEEDLSELSAFMDWLLKGPEKLPGSPEGEELKMYDFMDGGLEEKKSEQLEKPEPL